MFNTYLPVLTGDKVELKLPLRHNFEPWKTLRQESRIELSRYEPAWGTFELSRGLFADRIRQANAFAKNGEAFSFLIFAKANSMLLGGITLGNIRRGAAQTGEIGYWLGTRHCGQGYMQDAIATLLKFAFANLHLHRVEAACIHDNARSIALLVRSGFQYEGSARSYLEINGRRQDQHLYACLPSDM